MKVKLMSRTWTTAVALMAVMLVGSATQAYGYASFSLSSSDYGALTWWYFNEAGYTTDSLEQCGSSPSLLSPCFTYQLNTDTSPGTTSDFYQGVLEVTPDSIWWEVFIGCPPPGYGSCAYLAASSDLSGGAALINDSTSDVFVMAIDSGSSDIEWGVTSCNTAFDQPGYSMEFFTLSLSTCDTSNSYTASISSSYFPSSTFSYIQSVPVGEGGGSEATFEHTQVTGELFNLNLGTYTGSSSDLTAETSNMNLDHGTLGNVVPLCYYSPDVSNPC